jgi:hypothetical protein
MSHPDFLTGLEAELRLRGVAFDRADVLAFADAVWPLAQEDTDPVKWADCFLEAGHAERPSPKPILVLDRPASASEQYLREMAERMYRALMDGKARENKT